MDEINSEYFDLVQMLGLKNNSKETKDLLEKYLKKGKTPPLS